jgi:hypothetical protein
VKYVLNIVCAIIVVNSKENNLVGHFHKRMAFTVGFIVNDMKPCIRQVMAGKKLEEISTKMETA